MANIKIGNKTYDGVKKLNIPLKDTAGTQTYVDTSDANATAGHILEDKTAYVNGSKVTGKIVTRGEDDLVIYECFVEGPAGYYPGGFSGSIDTPQRAATTISATANETNDTLVIRAVNAQEPGYVYADDDAATSSRSATDTITLSQDTPTIDSSTGVVSATARMQDNVSSVSVSQTKTLNLPTQGTTTITPGTSEQTAVEAGRYTTGAIKVVGDPDLVSANIKSGASIFGVTGSYSGPSVTDLTADGTATAGDILEGKVAYAKGNRLEGTIVKRNPSSIDGTDVTVNGNSFTARAGYYPYSIYEEISPVRRANTEITNVTTNRS